MNNLDRQVDVENDRSGWDIYPRGFIERMKELLGADLDEFLARLSEPAEGLRVNTLRLAPDALKQRVPFRLEPLGFAPEAFVLEGGTRAGRHPYHAAGLYYLQDPPAMAVARMIAPQPGERVLDLAAAPGGKATHLAALMGNTGVLVANDVSAARARELLGNVERCGVRNTIVLAESVGRLVDHFGAYFDRVLLDAPCSGEAMFHKSAAARSEWSEAAVAGCARRQQELLLAAAELTREEGLLVYSTCTFEPEENEEVVARFLDARADFVSEVLAAPVGAEGGSEAGYRLWPHRVPGAGHFVAGFRRAGAGGTRRPDAWRTQRPRDVLARFETFRGEVTPGLEIEMERVTRVGENLFEVPAGAPSVAGLRVVGSGLRLGRDAGNRFEPAHALAMATAVTEMPDSVALAADDPRVQRYLQGHPIEAEGRPGWTVVMVDGFPLGWGKRSGSTVKNHYPKGLRWRN